MPDKSSDAAISHKMGDDSLPHLSELRRPPMDSAERERIGDALWASVFHQFVLTLSKPDVLIWASLPDDPTQSPDWVRLRDRFDDFVIERFAEFGWGLLMSRAALDRIAEWALNCPERMERMGAALARFGRIARGEAVAPFAPDTDVFADAAIPELQTLLRRQRDEFGSRPLPPTCERIAAWAKLEIESQPAYETLRPYLYVLIPWIETLPLRNSDLAATLAKGDLRAQTLFTQWYADCTNRSLKDVQNKISELRRIRRP